NRKVGRGGGSNDERIASKVDRDTGAGVVTSSAQISREKQGRTAGIELCDEYVRGCASSEGLLVRTRGGSRKSRGIRGTRHVKVGTVIDRNAGKSLSTGAAQITRVTEDGINDQHLAAVVGAHLETNFVLSQQDVASVDRQLGGSFALIQPGRFQPDTPTPGLKHQIARGQLHVAAFEVQLDPIRVGTRGNFEVVLQLTLFAVVDEVDARINIGVANARVLRNVAVPLGRVTAHQVVAVAGKRIGSAQLGFRLRADQLHVNHGGWTRCVASLHWMLQRKHCVITSKK